MFTNVKNKQYQSIDDYVYKRKKQAVSIYCMIMFTKRIKHSSMAQICFFKEYVTICKKTTTRKTN